MKGTYLKAALAVTGLSMMLVAGEKPNLLTNGDFEGGKVTGWSLEVNESDGAAATRELDSTSGTAHGGKIFHRIKVTAVSSAPEEKNWHVQLKDPTYTAKKGYSYHFSMWARCDADNKAQISVYGKDNSYKTSSALNLTTEWKQYHMVYVADADGPQAVNFAFVVGYAVGVYDIDDVVITEAEPTGNIYSNGDFEMDGAGWGFYVQGDSGKAEMTIESEGAQSGSKFCRINVTNKAEEDWQVQLSDGSWTSQMGAEYTFTFWAKSDVETSIQVAINAGASRNYGYVTSSSYTLGTEWEEYTFYYMVEEGADSLVGKDSLNFNFYCGAAVAKIDIDNIILQAAVPVKKTLTQLNKATPRFEVNILPSHLQCGLPSGALINKISIHDLQGKVFYSKYIRDITTGNYNVPRPSSGSWIVNVDADRANMSRTIVIP